MRKNRRGFIRVDPLQHERLLEMLTYDKDTGEFYWNIHVSTRAKGCKAGSYSAQGYIMIQVDKKIYAAHRLAWYYVYGYYPEHQIDHINRVRDDNRIINLREVTQSCNSKNTKVRSDNNVGVTGVTRLVENEREIFIAYIGDKRNLTHLGRFRTLREAVEARYEAELKSDFDYCSFVSSAKQFLDACNE